MQEHTKREESLREEFLEGITGAGGILSLLHSSNNFRDCVECQVRTQAFERHVSLHDRYIASVNHMEGLGQTAMVDRSLQVAGHHQQMAQETYQAMAAHGHPDFPAALNQRRQNSNPSHH